MKPATTTYRLVNERTGTEVPAIKWLWKKAGFRLRRLGFPTVIAVRDSKLIGFLSTHPTQKQVCAGPLVVDVEGNKAFVAMRLVDFYEKILVSAGVRDYTFHVDIPKAQKSYLNTIDQFNCRELGHGNYRREL